MFSLTELQLKELYKWIADREQESSEIFGAIGGRYTYSFTSTSLGIIIVVKDNLTQKEINLTDYDSW